jgi:hypothetical protein
LGRRVGKLSAIRLSREQIMAIKLANSDNGTLEILWQGEPSLSITSVAHKVKDICKSSFGGLGA